MAAVEGLGTAAAVLRRLILFRTTVCSAAAVVVAALGLLGCSQAETPPPSIPPSTTAAPSTQAALPDPAALTDVLAKLSDPAVPGADKLALVEGAAVDETPALDSFARALQDNHMLPLTFAATDLTWSEQSLGDVRATVTITPAEPDSGPFTFPMDFRPTQTGWQLSRETADLLLAFGNGPNTGPTPSP